MRGTNKTRRGALLLAIVAAVGLATSCSAIVGSQDSQCSSDEDCDARGFDGAVCRDAFCVVQTAEDSGESDAGDTAGTVSATSLGDTVGTDDADGSSDGIDPNDPWSCVGNVVWDEEQERVTARAGLHFTNSVFQPYVGATLQACSPLDLACAPPLSMGTSDRNGDAFVDVFYGFDGYFRSPPPERDPDILPFILYIYPPPFEVETQTRDGDVLLIDQATIDLLASLSNVETEPDMGYIFFTANDCNVQRTPGVTVSISPVGTNTRVAYLEGSFPNAELTETDDSGQGAIINVPPGLVEVTGVSLEAGKFFERSILVEPNRVTGIPVVPAPL